jgi:hypothetical protein
MAIVREFCKEEVVMPETKKMAEEATRMAQETQEQAKRVGQEYQSAAESGFEAASRSFAEINRGPLPPR